MSDRRQPDQKVTVTTADRATKIYSLILGREGSILEVPAVNYITWGGSETIVSSNAKTISSSDIREPHQLTEEISVEEWKRSLLYSESAVDDLLRKILLDFELDPTSENTAYLKRQTDEIVSIYENKYQIRLPDATRSMVKNLIVRMAYDKLCIKNLV